MKPALYKNIGVQVVIAMVIGALVGALMGEQAAIFAPLGTIFIHLIKMLVIPLIGVSIIAGAANLGNSPEAGKIGISTFAFFMLSSALAVALALVMGWIFQPGHALDLSHASHLFSNEYSDKGEVPGVMDTIIGMIPENVFASLMDANILQIMVFCLFLGIALSKQPKEKSAPIMDGLDTIIQAFIWMINVVMLIAPIGVFGLMADSVGTFGFTMLTLVTKLFAVYVASILIFGFVFYP